MKSLQKLVLLINYCTHFLQPVLVSLASITRWPFLCFLDEFGNFGYIQTFYVIPSALRSVFYDICQRRPSQYSWTALLSLSYVRSSVCCFKVICKIYKIPAYSLRSCSHFSTIWITLFVHSCYIFYTLIDYISISSISITINSKLTS